MKSGGRGNKKGRSTVDQLERLLVGMCNMAESLFADAVVAFLDGRADMVKGLRAEDYRTHERWLEIDQLAMDLLSTGGPDPQQMTFIGAAMKIAGGFKRAADESLRIGESLRACQVSNLAGADSLPRMIELTQSMLGDAVEALLNQDATQASALYLVFRELSALCEQGRRQLGEAIEHGSMAPHVGVALVGVTFGLGRIGDEMLGIANQVAHIYRTSAAG
jgi:phosphate uptake regulator